MTAHTADRQAFAVTAPAYPQAFYIAHKLFRLPNRAPVWGDLLDGPTVSFCDVVTDCFDGCDSLPTPADLRVWHVSGGTIQDVTAEVIGAIIERQEANYA